MRRVILISAASVLIVTGMGAGVRAATIAIGQTALRFSEKTVDLHKGDTMVFANKDDVTHNVNVINDDDDLAADLGVQKPGEDLKYTFDKAGRFKIRCAIHPRMKMIINVN